MEYGKKSLDSQVIEAMVEALAFYMHESFSTDSSLIEIRDYYKEWDRFERSTVLDHIGYIWDHRETLFLKELKLGYSDAARDFFISDVRAYFEQNEAA